MRETVDGLTEAERTDAGRTDTLPMLLISVPAPPGPISRPAARATSVQPRAENPAIRGQRPPWACVHRHIDTRGGHLR
ncbi:hypothetical protein GCM10023328_41960 [Modestobacter marinus]|uniref:Uncharacterized protein n=1 Tax=Modestobacter marinus TaxID=477641 RepID=A0ABQ2FV78_9ACTN|nr:hypothetical protein GCM10011589_12230 [Modestobacter marinus]